MSDTGDTDEIPSVVSHLLLWDGKTRTPLPTPPIPPDATISGYSLRPETSIFTYSQHTKQLDPQTKTFINQKYELVAWDYRANRVLRRTELSGQLYRMQLSPDGKWLAGMTPLDLFVGQHFRLCVFDRNGKIRYTHGPIGNAICWSPDSKRLVTAEAHTIQQSNPLTRYIEIHRFKD